MDEDLIREAEDWARILKKYHSGVYRNSVSALLYRLAAHINNQGLEIEHWRECAKYDATMEGPVFKGWDQSALNRCRRAYTDPLPDPRFELEAMNIAQVMGVDWNTAPDDLRRLCRKLVLKRHENDEKI